MFRSLRFHRALPLLLAGLFAPLSTQAAIFTVGPLANGCTDATIATAVAAAEASPGADTIRVTRSVLYNAQQLIISTQQDLNLVGGFATCTSTASDGVQTVLDGAGGAAAPVLRITAQTADTVIKLRLLRITGGDSTGDGGGIRFNGQGTLELIETTVNLNDADAGGGIHVRGSGPNTLLLLSNDNLIAGNRARSGGGIYIESAELRMVEPGSSIFANTATETGGGLRMYATDALDVIAVIGSTGFPPLAAIEGNTAAVGGGAALFGSNGGSSELTLGGASQSAPVVIRENFASQRSGAIDLRPTAGSPFSVGGQARARLENAVLAGNAAPTAAAVYADTDFGGGFFSTSLLTLKRSRLVDHVSQTSANVPTDGPIVIMTERSVFSTENAILSGNNGGPLVLADSLTAIKISDSLISGNTARGGLLRFLGQIAFLGEFLVDGTTIVGNTITTGPVIRSDDDLPLGNSIIWQPGTMTLQGASALVDDVLASEIASLGSNPSIISAEPRFIDPAAGDYRLQAASPAIDFSGAALGDGFDLDGAPRGVDLARVADFNGPIDLGAYERSVLGDLALNPQFVADRRLWDAGIPGSTATWVATGAANGGSVTLSMVAAPAGTFTGLRQCIRIPGPGRYRLSGLAYGSGADAFTRDDVSLRWNLRNNTGGETCTGTIDAQGSVEFNNTASWSAPSSPGMIDVSPSLFSRFTNVEVLLQVREGSLNVNATSTGFFDEIALVADDTTAGDAVFANGFEP